MLFKEKYLSVLAMSLCMNTVWAQQSIIMQVGDIEVIPFEKIARVAVGDSKIVHVNTDDDKELILFARTQGKTSLEVWNSQGERQGLTIEVRSPRTEAMKEEIRRLVENIPHVKASIVGEKIIVEGDRLSDADRERLQKLAQHYPQIIDMSSQIGWDEMVMLDVQIVELPRHFLEELGMKWSTQGGIQLGGGLEAHSSGVLHRPVGAIFGSQLGARAAYSSINTLLSSSIQAMASQGQAVILAQPQLMARSGATAEFLAGGEVPYSVADGNGNTQTIFKPYGVSLYITPRIEKNGIIRSKINVEVSAVDSSLSLNGGPALKTRRTSTEFNAKSGEPLVLSGFISRDQMQGMERLPGASDLPILGELFRSRRFQQNETELVVIVKPVVVSASHPQIKQRIHRTKAILESSFESEPLINVEIHHDPMRFQKIPAPVLKNANKVPKALDAITTQHVISSKHLSNRQLEMGER